MNKWRNIFYGIIFTVSAISMMLGIFTENTWQFLAGFWMMMYIMDRLDKID